MRPYVRYFHSSQYLNDLASGEVCLSVGWSGGIEQARQRGAEATAPVEVTHVIPKEGAPLWCDMVAIPAEAVRNNPSIYPSEEVYRRLTIDRSWSPEQMHAVNRVWTRIKAAR